jgi:hypothetical protein
MFSGKANPRAGPNDHNRLQTKSTIDALPPKPDTQANQNDYAQGVLEHRSPNETEVEGEGGETAAIWHRLKSRGPEMKKARAWRAFLGELRTQLSHCK